jgi:radical SAM protein with 4Fe4S-binding SPASM domain
MIVYKQNYKDIVWIKEFAEKNGIDFYIGYSRNANLLNNQNTPFVYTNEEIEEIEKLLYKVKWLNKNRLPNWLWAKSIYQNNTPYFECYMGQKSIIINPYGDVYPCNECLEFLKMGNLNDFNGDLKKLLYSKQAIDVIKKIKNKECQICKMLCAHKIKFPWGNQKGLKD